MSGNQYATFEEKTGYTEEKNLHVRGTIERPNGIEFWLSQPRPKDISLDDWETLQEAKWNRIFKKEVV